ncbi:MAG: flagellar motor switch protein FliG [Deltaproteobacteria bacterium]|nr:flagellar motor switch protein FliG [Deltaproteobacteria bacterium]
MSVGSRSAAREDTPRANTLLGAIKAAGILQILDEDLVPEVLAHLPDRTIARILAGADRLQRQGGPTPDELVQEFHSRLTGGVVRTNDTVLSLSTLEGKLDAERLRNVLKEQTVLALQGEVANGSGGGLQKLGELFPATLSQFFANEHPQITAVVLAHLSPEISAQVLSGMPDDLRAEVLIRMSRLEQVDPSTLLEVSEILGAEFQEQASSATTTQLGGVESVAEVLNRMDRTAGTTLLDNIEKREPEMVERIRELMFVFDDLVQLSDRDLQLIVKDVPRNLLVLAMKTVSPELKDKIFANISKRAAGMLQEDLDALGPMRLSEVEKAQREVVEIVRKLESGGQITMPTRGDSGDVLV